MAYTEKQHQLKVNAFEDITIELRNLYDAKNLDYGDSFGQSFQKWGLPMSCIRLGDKLNRLESFAKKKDMYVSDESVEDTLRDLANYTIMTLIELQMAKKETEGEQLCLK
jgi:hypothetical protein